MVTLKAEVNLIETGEIELLLGNVGIMTTDYFKRRIYNNEIRPSTHPKTLAERRRGKKRSNSQITLLDTGELVKSIDYATEDRKLEIGTNIEYAEDHLLGKGVPKRDFLKLDETIVYRINDYLGNNYVTVGKK